ncbi:MAG TPA: O-antigen ligase family protein [Afifellaceae bacterium]|nr:O-antigen ligase family protein [Afifellaceae bacterium]
MPATIATALLVLCIAWAPAALGSNRPLPWAVNALLAGAALLFAAWHTHAAGRSTAERLAPAALPLLLVCATMTWMAAQALVPAPAGVAHPAWREAGMLADGELTGRISANPRENLLGLLRLATAAATCLAALLLARNPARARFLLDALIAAAALYALYGLYRLALTPDKVLWFDARPAAYLSGPFLSRSQAATYFGLATVAALATLIQHFRRLARPFAASTLRVQVAGMLVLLPWALGARLAALLLIASAVLLTGSRAGIAATAAAMAAVVVLEIARNARRRRNRGLRPQFLLAGVVVVLIGVVFAVAGERIADRLLGDGLAPGARLDVYRMTQAAIADHAWIGSGYGTFQDVFPLYRGHAGAASFTWDKAHNDYLELMLGLGLPAAGLFLWALTAAAVTVTRGALHRRRGAAYPASAAAGTLLVGLHALVDFSLQIQAITLAYALLLGVGLAQASGSARVIPTGTRHRCKSAGGSVG